MMGGLGHFLCIIIVIPALFVLLFCLYIVKPGGRFKDDRGTDTFERTGEAD